MVARAISEFCVGVGAVSIALRLHYHNCAFIRKFQFWLRNTVDVNALTATILKCASAAYSMASFTKLSCQFLTVAGDLCT